MTDKPSKIGLCVVIDFGIYSTVYVYVLESYELAMEQAIELQKDVTTTVRRHQEQVESNGMRSTQFVFPAVNMSIIVKETEIGNEVIELRLGQVSN